MNTDGTLEELLRDIRDEVAAIEESIPRVTVVDAALHSAHSKLPFKAGCIRELHLHRVAELSRVALESLEANKLVTCALTARACAESVAILFKLRKAIRLYLESGNTDQLDDTLMKLLMGARWEDYPVKAINVMTLVEGVSKEVPGFSGAYDILSEYAHPNWSGVIGNYGKYDNEKLILALGGKPRAASMKTVANGLGATLGAFSYYYNDLADELVKLNEWFDQKTAKS